MTLALLMARQSQAEHTVKGNFKALPTLLVSTDILRRNTWNVPSLILTHISTAQKGKMGSWSNNQVDKIEGLRKTLRVWHIFKADFQKSLQKLQNEQVWKRRTRCLNRGKAFQVPCAWDKIQYYWFQDEIFLWNRNSLHQQYLHSAPATSCEIKIHCAEQLTEPTFHTNEETKQHPHLA